MLPSYSDFEELYTGKILPGLRKAEKIRRTILLNYAVVISISLIGIAIEAVTWMMLAGTFVIIFVLVYTVFYRIPMSRFVNAVHNAITQPVAEFIHPDFQFDRNKYFRLKDLKDSLFITGDPKQFGGSNYVSVVIDGQKISASEIYSWSESHEDMKETVRQHYFTGLVSAGNFQTGIKNRIVVMSDNLFDDAHYFGRGLTLRTKNHEFIAYYSDENAFSSLITPAIWLLMKQYYDTEQCHILLSASPDAIYAGVKRNNQQYVRPHLSKSVINPEPARNYYRDLLFLMQLQTSLYQHAKKKAGINPAS